MSGAGSSTRQTRLPYDLVICVLDDVFDYSESATHYGTIAACALVCRLWTLPSQRILFRVVELSSSPRQRHKTASFLQAITNAPRLGAYVRSISGIHVSNSSQLGIHHTRTSQFLTMLSFCPQLVELGLTIGQDKFLPNTLSRIAELPVRITHLSIASTFRVLAQLLTVWPCVRFLHLGDGLYGGTPPEHRPPFRLEGFSYHSDVAHSAIRWLLPPALAESGTSLLALDTSPRYLYQGSTADIFAAYAPHIRSLTVKSKLPAMEALTALEQLILHREPVEPFTLPGTIKHFGFEPYETIHGFESFLRITAALTSVPRLSIFTVNENVSQNDQSRLKEICERKNIQFRVATTIAIPRFMDRRL
ncbi:hypothetical protein BV25DRAFT_365339 [Artomyces pyxidatus]|uniref:Uncharacterized protein n=1 Tax=Artomyces pyxidatus TaxID=48021 RepID=A0ACB8T6S6_9AGAM|nr:hypothetical protein BV25DRAFT_365339 [Artomyces pyxidatus]